MRQVRRQIQRVPIGVALIAILAGHAFGDPKKSVFDDDKPDDTAKPPASRPANPAPAALRPEAVPAAAKVPVPAGAELAAAEKKVSDAFGDHDKAPLKERAAVATKMSDAAASMKSDPAAYYVLLLKCAALSASTGDVATALSSIQLLSDAFADDFDDRAVEWIRKASAVSLAQPAAKTQVEAAVAFARDATHRMKFDVAARALAATDLLARHSLAPTPLHALVLDEQTQLKSIQSEAGRAEAAKATLLKKPDDPEANFAVGHFQCLALDDWPAGLPALAKGANPAYKAAAAGDLAEPATAGEQVAAGDRWWDLADKEKTTVKLALQRHAMQWYDKAAADPTLGKLDRLKIENRQSVVASAATGTPDKQKWINLLSLIDPELDKQAGTWAMKNGVLTSDAALGTRLQIPYLPPEEYDFRIVFTRNTGSASIAQIASRESEEIIWVIGWPDGQFAVNEKTIIKKDAKLKNGEQFTSLLKVRRGGVQFFLNDKLILEEKDPARLYDHGLWYALQDHRTLGLASQLSSTSFFKIEVLEVSGHGKPLR